MKLTAVAFLAMMSAAALSPVAHATTYNFNMTYDGTALSLDPGSDAPDGTVLNVGDSFNISLQAVGANFWHVNSDYNVFVPLSFLVSESATRTADIATSFGLDGSIVGVNTFEPGVSQSFNHAGAQFFNLATGFNFDAVSLSWTLLAINTGGPTTISAGPNFFEGFGQVDAPFFNSPKITYGSVSAVPVPAALPLLFTAVAGLGALSRKRRRDRKAA